MTKQKFKNKEYTERVVVNNILRYYDIATADDIQDGLVWYDEAHDFASKLANRYSVKVQQSSGVISTLSPQTSWSSNKIIADSFIQSRGRMTVGNTTRLNKARKILKKESPEEILALLSTTPDGALKTKAFFKNILWPNKETDLTIDRHALATCFQRPEKTFALSNSESQMTKQQYMFIDQCYKKSADKVGIMKHQLQAVTWLTYRQCRNLFTHNSSDLFDEPLEDAPF